MRAYSLPDLGPMILKNDTLVSWEHPKSLEWLLRTPANKPFAKLARFYEAQSDKFMCAPASLAMVLNCLFMGSKGNLPFDETNESFPRSMNPALPAHYNPSFQRFTQRNIFSGCESIKSLVDIYGSRPGLRLDEMAELLRAHGALAKTHFMTEIDECTNHFDLKENKGSLAARQNHFETIAHALMTSNQYVIANFDRAVWGLKGGGHVSPIAALDFASQSALIMDVNMCGEWLWIDFSLLLESMASLDGEKPRGYLVVTKPSTDP